MWNKKTIAQLFILLLGATTSWAQAVQTGVLVPASSLGSTTPISKPVLYPIGGELILSDSPEQIADTAVLPAAFYRDTVHGSFRVFYHHQNITSNNLSVGLAITNVSDRPEILFAHGRGDGTSYYPNAAGQTALSDFLSTHNAITFLSILMPGQTYYSVQNTPSGDTTSGFEEYILIALAGKSAPATLPLSLLNGLNNLSSANQATLSSLPAGFRPGAAMVTTLVYSDSQPANPATIPILSPDTHIRGTFPHFDRVGVFSINTSLGLQNLDIDTAAPGLPYSDVMPGEYELGRDAVDSGIQVYNSGNYGVLYKFLIQLQSVTPFASTPLGILMQPTGGAGSYVMAVNGNKMLSPYVDYTSAWLFYGIHSSSKAAAIQLETSLTGGSAGPQRLYFAPNFKAQ